KIVVAGLSWDGTEFNDSTVTLVRYLDNGTLDPNFGGGTGKVTTAIGTFDAALALIQQADGKLVVAGYTDNDIVVVGYDTSGMPDTSFNGTGIVTTPVGTGLAEARALVQQASDGKLVVAGVSKDGTKDQFTLIRYRTDGMLDTAGFGTGGIVTNSVGSGDAAASGLALQADGKLVAGGARSDGSEDQV